MLAMENGVLTWEGENLYSRTEAVLLGEQAVEEAHDRYEAAMEEVREFEPYKRATSEIEKARNIMVQLEVVRQYTSPQFKQAWDFWKQFESDAQEYLKKIPYSQGCGWWSYAEQADAFLDDVNRRAIGSPHVMPILAAFGYTEKFANLTLRVRGTLALDAEDLAGEELMDALAENASPRREVTEEEVELMLRKLGVID